MNKKTALEMQNINKQQFNIDKIAFLRYNIIWYFIL